MSKTIHFISCSFCNKFFTEVEFIVQSNNGPAICCECIPLAQEIIDQQRAIRDKDAKSK